MAAFFLSECFRAKVFAGWLDETGRRIWQLWKMTDCTTALRHGGMGPVALLQVQGDDAGRGLLLEPNDHATCPDHEALEHPQRAPSRSSVAHQAELL